MSIKIAKIISCILFISSYTLSASDHISEEQPLTRYCHGLHCKTRRVPAILTQNILQEPATNVEFDDTQSSLGQSKEIEQLLQEIQATPKKCILHGHSRGGSLIINCLAQHNPSNVQAIIIDAAPADMVDRVDEIQYAVGAYVFHTREQKEWILRQLYPAYPKNSIPPIDSIPNIENKNLPVFLVHSDDDLTINIRAGLRNYKAFKQAGFSNVYFCNLRYGGHGNNAKGVDSHLYRTALHSFYKKYGFKHDPQQAMIDDLTPLQPTIEEIDEKIEVQEKKLIEKFQHRRAINIAIGVHAALILTIIIQDK